LHTLGDVCDAAAKERWKELKVERRNSWQPLG
jgi:hypothetical protein